MRLVGLIAIVLCAGCRKRFDDIPYDSSAGADASADVFDATMLVPDAAGCPASYTTQTGLTSKYRVVLATTTTWLEAEAFCEADGTHLIVINNTAENTFARSLNATVDEHVWLGGGDHRAEGTFEWITGEPMTFTRWGGAEPNNTMNIEDCMEIDSNGLWNDERNGGLATYHTVCECDGIAAQPARYCDTDADASCGTCGTSCGTGLTCTNQACN